MPFTKEENRPEYVPGGEWGVEMVRAGVAATLHLRLVCS
ncbi:hypothetical protein AVDCRST_MAG82-1128 [uncultured Rubrobacteraceae bacterium]|uniref:Uncharacterized protein n=1 Tax=uncultured Rubrobacteraceae bacterium TaxID=349277 RepID=A0A6J4PJF7_9ACTN|nr:hypothetical protein AVDCRST_MAG82-1128 [uncultured Rubrobacteraceae bacterium]